MLSGPIDYYFKIISPSIKVNELWYHPFKYFFKGLRLFELDIELGGLIDYFHRKILFLIYRSIEIMKQVLLWISLFHITSFPSSFKLSFFTLFTQLSDLFYLFSPIFFYVWVWMLWVCESLYGPGFPYLGSHSKTIFGERMGFHRRPRDGQLKVSDRNE